MKVFKIVCVATLLTLKLTLLAQFTGAGSLSKQGLTNVSYVKDNANRLDRLDQSVKLKGYIVQQINYEDYWFRDSTGKIKVEIEPQILPPTPFNEKSELILIGEVDSDLLEGVEIEVSYMEIVKTKKQ